LKARNEFRALPAVDLSKHRDETTPTGGETMNQTYRFRLVFLVSALALVAALTLWGVQQSWSRINSLEHHLTASQIESFRLATDFQGRLQTLNSTLLQFAACRDPAARVEFQRASEALNIWIDQHDPDINRDSILTTDAERRILPELNRAYDAYRAAANGLLSNQQPAVMTAEAYEQFDHLGQQSRRLAELGSQLAAAHEHAQEAFLADTNHALAALRAFLMGAILIMVVLVGVLGMVLYRDLVRPLRVRLVQSVALLESQEKLATLGTLAAGIAHEIRNPLTSIKARLYTLGKHIRDNPSGLADADIIVGEIARLERIVRDVLSFARPSEPKRSVVPAGAPLGEVHSLMAGPLKKSGVRLVLEPADGLFVSMDAGLIKQVLINLVRNAAEAVEGGGTVTLRARGGRAPLQGAEREVAILEVADTGKGIPPDVEARLFDPFFTTKEAGTGLGLSIAARIVEKHGGLLQYQTQVGRGTTFGIVLPSVPPASGDASSVRQNC
jgi:signal transduction histidine kinase